MGRPRKIKTMDPTLVPSQDLAGETLKASEDEIPLVSGISMDGPGNSDNLPGGDSGPVVAPVDAPKRKYAKKVIETETVPDAKAPEIVVRALYGVMCSLEISIASKKFPPAIAEAAFAADEKHIKVIMEPAQVCLAPYMAYIKGGEKWVSLVASIYQVESDKFRRLHAMFAEFEQRRMDAAKTPGPTPDLTKAAAAGSDGLLPN